MNDKQEFWRHFGVRVVVVLALVLGILGWWGRSEKVMAQVCGGDLMCCTRGYNDGGTFVCQEWAGGPGELCGDWYGDGIYCWPPPWVMCYRTTGTCSWISGSASPTPPTGGIDPTCYGPHYGACGGGAYTTCPSYQRERWWVRNCASGTCLCSAECVNDPTCVPPTPAPPSNINYSCNASGTAATISWTRGSNANYTIIRLDRHPTSDWFNGSGGDQFICPLPGLSSYTASITPGATYWIRGLEATNADCSARYGNVATSINFTCPLPGPSLSGTYSCSADLDPGQAQAQLSWTAVTGANRYELRFCTGTTCNPSSGTVLYTGANRTFNHNDRLHGTTYRYIVRAGVTAFNHWGAWSNTRNIAPVCPIATPTPTPWIRAYSRNPALTLLPITQFRHEQYTTAWISINSASNTSSFTSASVYNTTRGVAACWDPATRVNVGVTPAPAGTVSSQYASGSLLCRRVYWGNWNTGLRQATFIFVTPTPGATITPTLTSTPGSTPTPTLTVTPTMTVTPTPGALYSVSGKVWLRSHPTDPICTDRTDPLDYPDTVWTNGGAMRINYGVPNATVDAVGDYSFSGIPAGHTAIVTMIAPDLVSMGYELACPSGGSRSTGPLAGNYSGLNFYLRLKSQPWWQVVGGDVAALDMISPGGSDPVVESNISGSYTESKYIIARGSLDQGVIVQGSSIAPNYGGGDGRTETSNWWANAGYTEPYENFDYFYGLIMNGPNFSGNYDCTFGCSTLGGSAYNYYDGDVAVSGHSAGTTQTVHVVEGNLVIDGNITVDVGGFVGFIVRGNILINPGVTQAQGVYVANGTITSASGGANMDSALESQGTFVGWGGVSLTRDLADDASAPGERFTWRPDLLINAPDVFRRDTYLWEELQP